MRKTVGLIIIVLGICFLLLWACSWRAVRIAQDTYPPLGNFVQLDEGRVHYIQKGKPLGTAPVIIFLHGAGGNLRDWTYEIIPAMQDSYTIFAFDRPGHGYTDVFDHSGETIFQQVKILHDAAKSLGIEKSGLIGYSFGGAVALAWALDKPESVSNLTLVSSVSNPWTGPVSRTYHLAGNPLTGAIYNPVASGIVSSKTVRDAYGSVFTPQNPPEAFLDHIGVPLTVRPKSFRANARQVLKLLPSIKSMAHRYHELTLPIEMIHGDADNTLPISIHADTMHKIIPSINYTRLTGMGHGTHVLASNHIIKAIDRLHAP